LQHPNLYADKVKDIGPSMKDVGQYAAGNTAITFTNDNLLLGFKLHNPPLFVTGTSGSKKLSGLW